MPEGESLNQGPKGHPDWHERFSDEALEQFDDAHIERLFEGVILALKTSIDSRQKPVERTTVPEAPFDAAQSTLSTASESSVTEQNRTIQNLQSELRTFAEEHQESSFFPQRYLSVKATEAQLALALPEELSESAFELLSELSTFLKEYTDGLSKKSQSEGRRLLNIIDEATKLLESSSQQKEGPEHSQ